MKETPNSTRAWTRSGRSRASASTPVSPPEPPPRSRRPAPHPAPPDPGVAPGFPRSFPMTTTITSLTIEPLTREAFAPFGDVIQADDAARHITINEGNTERYHDLAQIDPGEDGRAIVSIFRGLPRTLPFTITMMERHPKASQAFIPLSGRPYLVVVAQPASRPS